jgi:hypothetical protein
LPAVLMSRINDVSTQVHTFGCSTAVVGCVVTYHSIEHALKAIADSLQGEVKAQALGC